MSIDFSSLLLRRYRFYLSSRSPLFYNVASVPVRRNFSVTSQSLSHGQGNQRPKVFSAIDHLSAFRLYVKGHDIEPYGGQGKEARDLFLQTLTKTFESVAEAHRRSHIDSSDTTKLINPSNFLFNVFQQVLVNFETRQSFDQLVFTSYVKWVMSFTLAHVLTMNNSGRTSKSMLQDSADSIEMFLEDYFRGIPDQTQLKTRINQIVDDLFYCMEDHLSHPGIEESLEGKGLCAGISGLVGMNTQEGWATKLSHEDWQHAWNQPFRGKSLTLLKQKLALNVNALQRAKRPTRTRISKLEMSRIIPIIQSSGTGKSRLAEEYDSSDMLCNA